MGAKVTIKAKAEGPKAKEAKWTKSDSVISGGSFISGGSSLNLNLMNSGETMAIDKPWEITFDQPITITLTFEPASNNTKNGVPDFEGKETFKIVITK